MTPEQSRVLLGGVVLSIDLWVEALEEIGRRCPDSARQTMHLLASMRQARQSLGDLMARSDERRS